MSWPTALVLIALILGVSTVLTVGLLAAMRQPKGRLNLTDYPIEEVDLKGKEGKRKS